MRTEVLVQIARPRSKQTSKFDRDFANFAKWRFLKVKKKTKEEKRKKVRRDVRWSFELLVQRCNKTTTTLRTRTHTVIYQLVSRDIFRSSARISFTNAASLCETSTWESLPTKFDNTNKTELSYTFELYDSIFQYKFLTLKAEGNLSVSPFHSFK